ncbi:MAG: NUDIX domain-containing protein [Nanoarchaeota archaeon]
MYNNNLTHYIVVTGILVKDGKYLIVKRANWEKAFPGKWTFPGGKLEVLDYALRKKDTSDHWYNVLENLLERELKEEIGLEVKNINYVASMVYIRPDQVPCLIVNLSANLKDPNQQIVLCNALTDFAWVDLGDAKNYDLIEGIYEELQVFDKKLKGEKIDRVLI